MIQTAAADQRAKYNDTGEVFSKNFALAMIVITGGFLLMLTGIFLSTISFVTHGRFHGWDITTLIASFVLLAVGAHFLDKADFKIRKRQIEEFEKIKQDTDDSNGG